MASGGRHKRQSVFVFVLCDTDNYVLSLSYHNCKADESSKYCTYMRSSVKKARTDVSETGAAVRPKESTIKVCLELPNVF